MREMGIEKLLLVCALWSCLFADSHGPSDWVSRPGEESEQRRFERLLRQHHRAAHQAHEQGGPEVGPFQPGTLIARAEMSKNASLPATIREAYEFYLNHVERHDWGSVRLFECRSGLAIRPSWIVTVTTDGDDGWVELFDASGLPLAAGRTYLELVAWGKTEEIRSFVATGGFPDALEDRSTRTIWSRGR